MKINQKNKISFFLILAMAISSQVRAQENAVKSTSDLNKLKPIEVHYETLSGLTYSINDELLLTHKDFENLINSLNDFEAIRLLKRSESSESNGKIFKVIGLAGVATGVTGLLTCASNQRTPFWITTIGSGVLFDIGEFFQTEAQTTKFNSIQRYNRFARGEEQVLPKNPQDEKSLLKFDQPIETPVAFPQKNTN